ncbi:hypothetical protein MPTK1_7g02320 [Marchantia polymorpha subsp. ruderalis]|uniref:Uncharacterized protein n=2 Tax=Marchantia polymorpha TaxID=3197 RepID=A0AAF6BVC8_MARPO|nr:hypothetical protein MARPO_0088s0056 [Marchantia polymorpha]BBN15962.1 hypothetical protein Mp_7g02320 [Marchantia polymorpha subsp. ruderalis]|eukprot:PTQ33510.1 hypothetical protein MARPO_0088s0056 [Marchantia polymorpha]
MLICPVHSHVDVEFLGHVLHLLLGQSGKHAHANLVEIVSPVAWCFPGFQRIEQLVAHADDPPSLSAPLSSRRTERGYELDEELDEECILYTCYVHILILCTIPCIS